MSELMTLIEVGGPAVVLGGGATYLRAKHPAAFWCTVGPCCPFAVGLVGA